jgi:hypothetical protein
MKANDAIREDYCRYFHSRERNCEGPAWANRYALGYLFKHLKDLYSGELVITGEPALKPYDIVFLYDAYNDMAGPLEVEQVTHIFSQETGFEKPDPEAETFSETGMCPSLSLFPTHFAGFLNSLKSPCSLCSSGMKHGILFFYKGNLNFFLPFNTPAGRF